MLNLFLILAGGIGALYLWWRRCNEQTLPKEQKKPREHRGRQD